MEFTARTELVHLEHALARVEASETAARECAVLVQTRGQELIVADGGTCWWP